MKALVYTAPNELVFRDEPDPTPTNEEAVVAVDSIGICGSDLHGYHGKDSRRVPPLILGHEASGTVLEGRVPGQRVALNPLLTCGRCDDCVSGRGNLCPERQLIGMARPGAFAEFVGIPERNLIPVPEGMSFTHAAVMEPAGVALHAVNLAAGVSHRPLAECRALVVGGGPIGLLVALVLASHGCRRFRLGELNPLRRETVAATGCCEVYDPANDPAPEANGFDVVFDAVGIDPTRAVAVEATRPGGVIVHVGLGPGSGGLDLRKITLQEISLIGCYTYNELDLRRALAALASGALGPLDWAETRPLAAGAQAFADFDRGSTRAVKLILQPAP
jgi:threonine dehydrogenase-like Zn-dependent dehydrogenase